MQRLDHLRVWLGRLLQDLAERLISDPLRGSPPPLALPERVVAPAPVARATSAQPPPAAPQRATAAVPLFSPASREPLSVEAAVLGRSMALLRRETADALAALGAAHALVTSARLSQLQLLRDQVERGQAPVDALSALAADYQGWQNDQVRLFDSLALVLRMAVPGGTALEQIDPQIHEQARAHLASLSAEYQRGLLMEQFRDTPSTPDS